MNNIRLPLLILLLVSDLIVNAARAALLNVRYAHLVSMQDNGDERVHDTIELVKQRSKLKASLKLAQALLRFLIAGLILSLLFPWETVSNELYLSSAMLILVAVLIWAGEYLVEFYVVRDPETWALRLTSLSRWLVVILSPILFLPLRLSRREKTSSSKLVTITESELKTLVDASQQAGVLEQEERQMIYSVFQLGDTLAREIMVPRIDIFALEVNTPLPEAVDTLLETGYSRVPIYEDQIDNVLGMLYVKDILKIWRAGSEADSLRSLLRKANFIPEAKKVDELLAEMQAQRIHIAIVVDEYGGVSGLVTLEDIVEEIFGEIRDEYDQREELLFQKVNDGEYLFHGRIDLDDFNEIMECQLSTDEADTLGGLIYNRIGRVPKAGESIQEKDLRLTVEQVSARRIRKVRAQHIPPSMESKAENQEDNNHAD